MKKIDLLNNERGATAIEYALIVGLIAIGVVGSLVGTRSSLQSTYGSVSSGLTSGAADVRSPIVSQQNNPLLANRTLASKSSSVKSWGSTRYFYQYTDGTTADYYTPVVNNGTYYGPQLTISDRTNNIYYSYNPSSFDPVANKTVPQGLGVVEYYPTGNYKTITTYSINNDGATMTGLVTNYVDSSNSKGVSGSNTMVTVSQFQSVYDQYNAYKANP